MSEPTAQEYREAADLLIYSARSLDPERLARLLTRAAGLQERAETAERQIETLEQQVAAPRHHELVAVQAVATLQPALLALYQAVLSIWGDPEDCAECGALSDAGEETPCRVCGSARLFHATKAAEEALGPCRCEHASSQHESEDTTRCKLCECAGFKLALLDAQPSRQDR